MISVVIPVYNEESNLNELYGRLSKAADDIKSHDFEFFFVDDHSTDNSAKILQELFNRDKRVRSARFANNCGSHWALSYGLTHCRGDAAIMLAADLQDPPEIMKEFIRLWEEGNPLVWGVRVEREGEKSYIDWTSRIFWRLTNWLTYVKVPLTGADICLTDRDVLEAFSKVEEKHTSIFMALSSLGFKQESVGYVKEARFSGESKWTLRRKIKLTFDTLTMFSKFSFIAKIFAKRNTKPPYTIESILDYSRQN